MTKINLSKRSLTEEPLKTIKMNDITNIKQIDTSKAKYKHIIEHLDSIFDEMNESNKLLFDKNYYTSLFKRMIDLSEGKPKRMQNTLFKIGIMSCSINMVSILDNQGSMWEPSSFPIPKDYIKMSLEGIETPFDVYEKRKKKSRTKYDKADSL